MLTGLQRCGDAGAIRSQGSVSSDGGYALKMALCCSCLALEVCVGSSFKSVSETMLSNGLQAVPYTSHRAYEDQVTFLCLELQESAVGV